MPALTAALGLLLLVAPVAAQSPSAPPPSAAPAPSPDPLRDFQDQPGTETTPGGLDWQQVDGPTQSRQARIGDLVAWAGGFAAIERRFRSGRESRLAIWSSPDGRIWTRAPIPDLDGAVLALLPFRGGLVLLTDDERVDPNVTGRAIRVHAWRSPDAKTWRRAGGFDDRVPRNLDEGWKLSLRTPFVVNGRIVVPVRFGFSTGAGGWIGSPMALRGVAAQRAPARHAVRLDGWWSRDGSTWSSDPMTDVPVQPTRAPSSVRGLDRALMESRDGLAWTAITELPPHFYPYGISSQIWADGASIVYGDNFDDTGSTGCGNRLGVWRLEPDGWVQSLDRQAAIVDAAATDGRVLVLLGTSWCDPSDADTEWPWLLFSPDGGRTWDPDRTWVGSPDACLFDLAIHESTVVTLACDPDGRPAEPHPAVWVAPLPAEPTSASLSPIASSAP